MGMILQIAMVITGLWALISGKIWLIDDKYTIKSSRARGIGALLISVVPLSTINAKLVINKYGYTRDAENYGIVIEFGICFAVAIIAYIFTEW